MIDEGQLLNWDPVLHVPRGAPASGGSSGGPMPDDLRRAPVTVAEKGSARRQRL